MSATPIETIILATCDLLPLNASNLDTSEILRLLKSYTETTPPYIFFQRNDS